MAQEQSADPGFSADFDPEALMKKILEESKQQENDSDADS